LADEYHLGHDLLTPTEVLEYLRVNVRTVYRLMQTGDLPAVRVGRQWRVQRLELDAWLRRQQPEPPWDRRPSVARGTGLGNQPPRVPPSADGDPLDGEHA
jgi:excisionase family DNA binding protein